MPRYKANIYYLLVAVLLLISFSYRVRLLINLKELGCKVLVCKHLYILAHEEKCIHLGNCAGPSDVLCNNVYLMMVISSLSAAFDQGLFRDACHRWFLSFYFDITIYREVPIGYCMQRCVWNDI